MKRFTFFAFFIMLAAVLLAPSSLFAQNSVKPSQEIFRATLIKNDDSSRSRQHSNSVVLEFSEKVLDGLEFYRVIRKMETEVRGNSKLIYDLYYEPNLKASEVFVYNDRVELFYPGKNPGPAELSNILNRVIDVVHRKVAPAKRLEIDGYNPLLGASLDRPEKFYIPPPINGGANVRQGVSGSKVTFQEWDLPRPGTRVRYYPRSNFAKGRIDVEYLVNHGTAPKPTPKKP